MLETGKVQIPTLEECRAKMVEFVEQKSRSWNPGKEPPELFHYTTPEGFIGIVTSKTLWASDMLSLNDASEAEYPQRVITAIFDQLRFPPEHSLAFEAFKTQLVEYTFRGYTPFVTCFCENGDLLSQWRGYGNQGEGFSLGFSVPWLISLEKRGFRLQRVIYDRRQQEMLIHEFLTMAFSLVPKDHLSPEDEVTFWKIAAACLAPWFVMFKDAAFQEEREWRIVNANPPNTMMQFRRAGNRIVPYVNILIDRPDAVTRVIRGPYFSGTDKRGAYLMLVFHNFMVAAAVKESQVPLRR